MQVNEQKIDQIIADLDRADKELSDYYEDLTSDEFWLAAFVSTEDIDILKDGEKILFQYIISVIYESYKKSGLPVGEDFNIEPLGNYEEANWEVFEKQKGSFRERLTIFFDTTSEEDLLAFVEDMLMAEEGDNSLSEIGRNVIFVKAKSLIDFLSNILERKAT